MLTVELYVILASPLCVLKVKKFLRKNCDQHWFYISDGACCTVVAELLCQDRTGKGLLSTANKTEILELGSCYTRLD